MAAPNLAAITTMTGKNAKIALSSTSMTTLVNNPASSGKCLKVDTIIVANVDGSNACNVTIKLFSQDDVGGTGYAIASTVSVPADASLIVLDSPIYLEEDQSIGVQAGTSNDLEAVASYVELS